ncbi:hypothetical protein [Lactiplantibacillus plantarum]|uniref:Uncharacterized protein n=1 Tax=Lactiplantibacillus plantarum subsp. plantarum TaxID=337330 RepID=A0A2S3U7S7_LACPN|nr:hypothetical protein [Lactiplantibacillus plantarum]MBY8573246.1 hypothetical protein [Lactiplantibacillus plantarum]POD87183.1 hypothetical protein S101258_00906 [Lactiplantibacillus plantarum subsp. plantarum]
MTAQLATNELSAVNDEPFRKVLISNFEILQQYLNSFNELADEINSDQSQQSADLDKKFTDMQQQMNDKINRITMGTDEDTIRLVVTAILQEQGVIK